MPCYDQLPGLKKRVIDMYQQALENGDAVFQMNPATGKLEIIDPNGESNKKGMDDSCIVAGIEITPEISFQLAASGLDAHDLEAAQEAHGHTH